MRVCCPRKFDGVRNRATISDSRSNFHTRVGYRTNVCRRWLASDLARASEIFPAQGALEDHHDLLPGSLRHRVGIPPIQMVVITTQLEQERNAMSAIVVFIAHGDEVFVRL